MRPTLVILKKELKRVFTDRRVLLSVFLPGVLMFVMYAALGNFMKNALSGTVTNTTYVVAYSDNNVTPERKPYVISAYEAYLATAEAEKTNKVELKVLTASTLEDNKNAVKNGLIDVYIHFSDNFDEETKTKTYLDKKQHIDLYYNGAKESASHAYHTLTALVDASYRNYLVNISGESQPIAPNVANKDSDQAKALGILIPVLTITITFSTVLTLTPDTIAGEKERGTLGAMLLAPIKRGSIVVGKLLSTLIVAALGGLINFIGLFGGMNFMGISIGDTFTIPMAISLALLIITATIFFVTIGLLVSTLTKSAKEASNYMIPFMLVAILAGVLTNTMTGSGLVISFIPFLNIGVCINLLVSTGTIPVAFMLITVGMNIAISAVICIIISQLFKRETLMVK